MIPAASFETELAFFDPFSGHLGGGYEVVLASGMVLNRIGGRCGRVAVSYLAPVRVPVSFRVQVA